MGGVKTVQAQSPVHILRLDEDGSVGLVVLDQGGYFYLDPSSATPQLQQSPALPLQGDFFIAHAEFIDAQTLAFGVLYNSSMLPAQATILVIDRQQGSVLYQKDLSIQERVSAIPGVDVTVGTRTVVGRTREATFGPKIYRSPTRPRSAAII